LGLEGLATHDPSVGEAAVRGRRGENIRPILEIIELLTIFWEYEQENIGSLVSLFIFNTLLG
jgi:hypothetical protein